MCVCVCVCVCLCVCSCVCVSVCATIAIRDCLVIQIGPFHQFKTGEKKGKARDRRRQGEEKSDENKFRARERARKREPPAHAQVTYRCDFCKYGRSSLSCTHMHMYVLLYVSPCLSIAGIHMHLHVIDSNAIVRE